MKDIPLPGEALFPKIALFFKKAIDHIQVDWISNLNTEEYPQQAEYQGSSSAKEQILLNLHAVSLRDLWLNKAVRTSTALVAV